MPANNSDTLQNMLSQNGVFTGKDPHSDYAPFNIECPAIKDTCPGLNAYKSHCEIRVVTEDSNEDCRLCQYGKKVAQRLNYSFTERIKCSRCNNETDGIHKTCEKCRERRREFDRQLGKEELNRRKRESVKRVRERKKNGGF